VFAIKLEKFLTWLLYLSLIFLGLALYKADYLTIPTIVSYKNVLISVLLLFCSFIIEAYAWKKNLNTMGFTATFNDALISMGLFVFGKYMPGKVWGIAGRSGYLAIKNNYPKKDIATVALINQMLSMWVGLWLGLVGLLFVEHLEIYKNISLLLIFFLTAVLFTKTPVKIIVYVYKLILKKKIQLKYISINQIFIICPWYFFRWLVLSLAFYFFVMGLTNTATPFYTAFGFAFAGNLALAVIFFPGGLGVREGLLFGFLLLCGFSIGVATTISITSRLWFLLGEVFIFGYALSLEKIVTKGEKGNIVR
jgi:glycosyltransferase 2 family protein